MKKSVTEILDLRQEEYGDAQENFTAIGRSWAALLRIEDIQPHTVALMMVQFKAIRANANPLKADSWDDLEGYAHHGRELSNGSR